MYSPSDRVVWVRAHWIIGQDTLLSQCLSPPRCINGYLGLLVYSPSDRVVWVRAQAEDFTLNYWIIGQDTLFSQCLSPPRCINGYWGLLVYSPSDRVVWVRAQAEDFTLNYWARHFALIVSLSTQMYKWVLANLMLWVTLWWSRGGVEGGVEILLVTSCCRNLR